MNAFSLFICVLFLTLFFPFVGGKLPVDKRVLFSYATVFANTMLYWLWESKVGGNIRVDLVIIYPLLFLSYVVNFWFRHQSLSLVYGVLLMLMNLLFFSISYDLFQKSIG